MSRTEKTAISLNLDTNLLNQIDEIRKEKKMTRNSLISLMCYEWIEKTETAKKLQDMLISKFTNDDFLKDMAKLIENK